MTSVYYILCIQCITSEVIIYVIYECVYIYIFKNTQMFLNDRNGRRCFMAVQRFLFFIQLYLAAIYPC